MFRITLISLFISIWASFSHGQQTYIPDVTQEKFETREGVIDHLIPSPPTNRQSYYIAEFSAYEALRHSWAWRIYKNDDKNTYLIKSWEIHKSENTKTPTEENILEREITEGLAQLIYKIWANSILESKYTLTSAWGLDGATYNFSTYLRAVGWISGETWSPSEELPPLWLVDLGRTIYKEARADKTSALSETTKIEELAEKISSYNPLKSSL